MKKYTILLLIILSLMSCKTKAELLIDAISRNNEVKGLNLIDKGAPLNGEEYILQPLNIAISVGNFNIIKTLIDKGADIEYADKEEGTPLNHAVKMQDKATIIYLLQRNVNVNLKVSNKDTFTLWAVHNEDIEIVRSTFSNKTFNPDVITEDGSPLIHSVIGRLTKLELEQFFEFKPDLSVVNRRSENPIEFCIENASSKKAYIEKAILLINAGAPLQSTNNPPIWDKMAEEWTDGFIKIADAAYETGFDINCEGSLALHTAVSYERFEYTKWLLEHGADPYREDSAGYWAINRAENLNPTMSIDDDDSYEEIIEKKKSIRKKFLEVFIPYLNPEYDILW